jgi:hypothetical protein
MDPQFRGAYRHFTVDTIFSDDVPVPDHKIIWRTRPKVTNGIADPTNEEMIQIIAGGINIVSSRDVRRNVRKSLEIALGIAAGSDNIPGKRVLYVNSYAGIAALREGIQAEMAKRRGAAAGDQHADQSIDCHADQNDFKSRFRILDCKMGMWLPCTSAIDEALYSKKRVNYHTDEVVITQQCDVLVLNSYEFAALCWRDKLDIANRLMQWLDKLSLTVIVFTQEVQAIMEAGIPVRGPLGLLTCAAVSVAKLDDVKKGRNRTVHEQVPNTYIKIFYTTGGNLESVEYPEGYTGHRYDLSFFPKRITEPVPAGIDAVMLVGRGKME